MFIVTLSSKGQIVLPQAVRNQLALREGAQVKVEVVEGKIVIEPMLEKNLGWRQWRGVLAGTKALEEHLKDHVKERQKDEDFIRRLCNPDMASG